MRPTWRIAVFAVVLGVVLAVGAQILSFSPQSADVKYDWLSAYGAIHGNAYDDPEEIAEDLGVSIVVARGGSDVFDITVGHPRTPGAILLTLPALLVPFDFVFALSVGVTVSLTVLMVAPAWLATHSLIERAAVILLTLVSLPLLITLRYGGQAAVVAALALSGWYLARQERQLSAGAVLGIAGVLKVFPLVLLIPLAFGQRWRTIWVTFASIMVLNLGGLLLPGVALGEAIRTLTGAAGEWLLLPGNGSLARIASEIGWPQVWAPAGVALAGLLTWNQVSQQPRSSYELVPWLALGLLTVPLSWISYDTILIPIVLLLAVSHSNREKVIGLTALILWALPTAIEAFAGDVGLAAFTARTFLLSAWLLFWHPRRDKPDNDLKDRETLAGDGGIGVDRQQS